MIRFDDVSEWEQNRCLADSSDSEAVVAAKFAQQALIKALEQLPERDRHIVSQHYFRDVKFKELGAEVSVRCWVSFPRRAGGLILARDVSITNAWI